MLNFPKCKKMQSKCRRCDQGKEIREHALKKIKTKKTEIRITEKHNEELINQLPMTSPLIITITLCPVT